MNLRHRRQSDSEDENVLDERYGWDRPRQTQWGNQWGGMNQPWQQNPWQNQWGNSGQNQNQQRPLPNQNGQNGQDWQNQNGQNGQNQNGQNGQIPQPTSRPNG